MDEDLEDEDGRHVPISPTKSSHALVSMPEVPNINVEEKDRGSGALVQTFYEGPPKCKCCTNWIERPPVQIPEAIQGRYDQAAIRVYKKRGSRADEKIYGGAIGQRYMKSRSKAW